MAGIGKPLGMSWWICFWLSLIAGQMFAIHLALGRLSDVLQVMAGIK